jgi:hypothetical protein
MKTAGAFGPAKTKAYGQRLRKAVTNRSKTDEYELK